MGYLIAIIGAAVVSAAVLIYILLRATAGVEYDGALWQTQDNGAYILREQISMTTQPNATPSVPLNDAFRTLWEALMHTPTYNQFVALGGMVVVSNSPVSRNLVMRATLGQYSPTVEISEAQLIQAASLHDLIYNAVLTIATNALHAFVNSSHYGEQIAHLQARFNELGNAISQSINFDAPASPELEAAIREMSELRQQMLLAGALPETSLTAPPQSFNIAQHAIEGTHQERIWQAQYQQRVIDTEPIIINLDVPVSTAISEEEAEHIRNIQAQTYERIQREYEEIDRREAERRAAAKRALEFLMEHLTEEQREDFEERGYFLVRGGSTGAQYRVRNRSQMNVDEMRSDSELTGNLVPVRSYCVVSEDEDVPLGDQLLMQKLMLEHDEKKFLKTANTNEMFGVHAYNVERFINVIDRLIR